MRLPTALAVFATLLIGADKSSGPPKGEASNRLVTEDATAYLDKESIDKAVGAEMEKDVVVLEVKLRPAVGQKINITLDDFILRSDKDGSRTTPYQPTQIAGSSVLIISERYSGGGVGAQESGPTWGGIGGAPSRLPGNGTGVGNTAGTAEAVGSMKETGKAGGKESPLLTALKAKILPEKETSETVTGQLYFLLEGKHKPKQIELIYKTAAGLLSVRFKE
jgi:hypothetical protein